MRALWLRKVAAGAWPKAHLRASRLNVSSGARADEEPDRLPCIRYPTLGFQHFWAVPLNQSDQRVMRCIRYRQK